MKKKKSMILNRGVILTVIIIVVIAVIGIAGMHFARNEKGKPRIAQREVGIDVYALEEEVRNTLGPECVAISTDRSSGSGILWSYDGCVLLVVTAGHLLQEFTSGEMELWSGEKLTFSGEDVQVYPEVDVAIIKLSSQQIQGGAGNYISEVQLEIGDAVWMVDSVYGPASGIHEGQVYAVDYFLEDYGAEMLLLAANGTAGMSGCPVYDEEGRLAAMMSGMSEDGSILAAVPVARILQIVQANGSESSLALNIDL